MSSKNCSPGMRRTHTQWFAQSHPASYKTRVYPCHQYTPGARLLDRVYFLSYSFFLVFFFTSYKSHEGRALT